MVQKRSGANTVEVANKVKQRLKQLQEILSPGIKFSILMDNSEHITQSIKDLTKTIYWGGLFVLLVVFFFYARSGRV